MLAGQCKFADIDLERAIYDKSFPCYRTKGGKKPSAKEIKTFLDELTKKGLHHAREHIERNPEAWEIELWQDDGPVWQYLDDSLLGSEHWDQVETVKDGHTVIEPGHVQHLIRFFRV